MKMNRWWRKNEWWVALIGVLLAAEWLTPDFPVFGSLLDVVSI